MSSYDASIAPDGRHAVVAAVDLGARLLDLEDEKVRAKLSGEVSRLNAVAYSPDGKVVAIATSTAVLVYSVPEGTKQPGFRGLTGAGSVAFSPDGQTLAVGGEDKNVHLFNVSDGSEVVSWSGHEGPVRALAWSEDGKLLASGSRDGGVFVWDVNARKRLTTITPRQGAVESLAWSAYGTRHHATGYRRIESRVYTRPDAGHCGLASWQGKFGAPIRAGAHSAEPT